MLVWDGAGVEIELAFVNEAEHFVAVVATDDVHRLLVLGPVQTNSLIAFVQWLERSFHNLLIPLAHVLGIVYGLHKILQGITAIKLRLNLYERSCFVELTATIVG